MFQTILAFVGVFAGFMLLRVGVHMLQLVKQHRNAPKKETYGSGVNRFSV